MLTSVEWKSESLTMKAQPLFPLLLCMHVVIPVFLVLGVGPSCTQRGKWHFQCPSHYAAPERFGHAWLSAPDISQNSNVTVRRHQTGTGTWLLDGAQFTERKEKPNVILCIYGPRELPYLSLILSN